MKEMEESSDQRIELITPSRNWLPSALSPDKRILVLRANPGVKLLDLTKEVDLGYISHHFIEEIVFSPDGKFLVGRDNKTLKIWEMSGGQALTPLKLDHILKSDKFAFTFGPNGKILVSEGRENTVKIWEAETGQELQNLIGHRAHVKEVAFSQDGKTLMSIDRGFTIKFWNPFTGQELKTLDHLPTPIGSITLSPNGTVLALDIGGAIRFWDVTTQLEIFPRFSTRNQVEIHDLDKNLNIFYPGGKTAVLKEDDREAIGFWLPFNGIFSQDGKILAGVGDPGSISLWDVITKQIKKTLEIQIPVFTSLSFSPDGKFLALAGDFTHFKIWNLESRQNLKNLFCGNQHMTPVFSPDGKLLAGASGRIVSLLDLEAGQEQRLTYFPHCFEYLEFSRDGKLLAGSGEIFSLDKDSGSDKKYFTVIWDVASGQPVESNVPREKVLNEFPNLFKPYVRKESASDKFLARIENEKIKLLDLSTGKEVAALMIFNRDDWLVTTPDNFFDGTPGALKNIIWRLDYNIFNYRPMTAYYERFFYPHLLPDLFAGKLRSSEQRNEVITESNSILLKRYSTALFVHSLSDEFLNANQTFFLAIRSAEPQNQFTEIILLTTRVGWLESIKTIVARALPGVPFRHVSPSPANILDSTFQYFLLETKADVYWNRIRKEKNIAVKVTPDLDILEIRLVGVKN